MTGANPILLVHYSATEEFTDSRFKVVARGIGSWRRAIRAVIAAEFKCKGVKGSDGQSNQCFREDLRLGLKDAFANASGAPTDALRLLSAPGSEAGVRVFVACLLR